MRHLKLVLLAALMVVAVNAITAAVANAEESLPSILWATAEAELKGHLEGVEIAKFNSAFASITAHLVLVELFATGGMADLGLAKILFEGSELNKNKCFTEGDSLVNGAVLIDNAEWHLVLDLPADHYSILILIKEFTLKCDTTPSTIKIRGSVLSLILNAKHEDIKGSEKGKVFFGMTECEVAGSRKAKDKEYDLHENGPTMGIAKLEASIGLGFEETCEEVKGDFEFSSATEIELMEP